MLRNARKIIRNARVDTMTKAHILAVEAAQEETPRAPAWRKRGRKARRGKRKRGKKK